MKKSTPIVHCIFSQSEIELSKLLEESFRLYLKRTLTKETDAPIQRP